MERVPVRRSLITTVADVDSSDYGRVSDAVSKVLKVLKIPKLQEQPERE